MKFLVAFLVAYTIQTILMTAIAPVVFNQPVVFFSPVRAVLMLLITYFFRDEILEFFEDVKNKFKNKSK